MATLRDIKTRIRSVRQIQKITAAMKLVSVAKLRKHQTAQRRFEDFRGRIGSLFDRFSSAADIREFPLMAARSGAAGTLLIAVTAERGLCGSYNHGVRRAAEAYLEREPGPSKLLALGSSNRKYFRNQGADLVEAALPESVAERARVIGDLARGKFLDGSVDRVVAVSDRFALDRSRGIRLRQLLPLAAPADPDPAVRRRVEAYLLEPGFGSIYEWICEYYLYTELYGLLLDAAAAEEFARMKAMELATSNADELIFELTLSYNKARQEAITLELLDIVGGTATGT
ncbi:MAG TPA: ATP synthase F1 subunit gamma [bacterium]|nr:ATP synthase F1 subunit gamma [bacterium]HPQ65280.1 ATP synthase F1 subunit gamma [bacterium]